MYLSLVIPFYNSEFKSNSILKTLATIDDSSVEIIFIDDGSTDNTYKKLISFQEENTQLSITVIQQQNKGPGGARNAGLIRAIGEYVWFIDSDDDINTDIFNILKDNLIKMFDFIEFIEKEGENLIDSMEIPSGEYTEQSLYRELLINKFGRLHSKLFKRSMLIDNNIFYPEYCYYEDNALAFILPFFQEKFLKIDNIGYIYQLDSPSITRSKPGLRSLDRLYTARLGLSIGLKYSREGQEEKYLKEKFITLFLINTVSMYISILPSTNWLTTWRIMKYYRKSAKEFKITESPLRLLNQRSLKFKYYFYFHWFTSYLLVTDQAKYFDRIRKKAWSLN